MHEHRAQCAVEAVPQTAQDKVGEVVVIDFAIGSE
jgi:hypothetical protein